MKRFEAEEELIRKQKLEEANKAEFDAEQTYLETLSYLPGKEADKYRDMQGVSWMYIEPPGMKGNEGETTEQQNKEASKAGVQRTAIPLMSSSHLVTVGLCKAAAGSCV